MKKKEGFSGQRTIVLPEYIVRNLEQDIITNSLYLTDIGYYPNAKYHFRQRQKGCEQHVLLYCISGGGWIEVDNRKTKLNENQVVVLPAGISHSYGSDISKPWSIYWLHFNGLHAQFYSGRLAIPIALEPDGSSRNEDRIGLFESIYSTLTMGYGIENLYYASICLQYFLGSMLFQSQFAHRDEKSMLSNNDVVSQCIHFMKENIEKKLTLHDLSNFSAYSNSHLTTLFKDRTGYSPIDYFISLKIQKACQYLDHSTMKITQISPKVGMEDPLYFSRIFQKKMGMSPSEYRKKEKG
jgi:AraC-like DNA-binding protein/mannose-6-phosphate isomerase-like protein (cupin superfamily)